jgi:hypothetical protein
MPRWKTVVWLLAWMAWAAAVAALWVGLDMFWRGALLLVFFCFLLLLRLRPKP